MKPHSPGETYMASRDASVLESALHRRAELHESMLMLRRSLSTSGPGEQAAWTMQVSARLVELQSDFLDHLAVTEGSDGLYQEILNNAPRLARAAHRLLREHRVILSELTNLGSELANLGTAVAEADVEPQHAETVRQYGLRLLDALERHQQRGADLVFEAYQTDLGGET
jgi:hypothetical protein